MFFLNEECDFFNTVNNFSAQSLLSVKYFAIDDLSVLRIFV